MEIATRSSWDLRISALRRMNKSLIDSELRTPKSMKAKQAKDSSCTEANTSNWRQKTKRAATLGGRSGPTVIHMNKPEPKVQETEPSFNYELDFPALTKKEHVLTHEETKDHDVFMAKTHSFEEFHLVHGGNLSTQTQVRKLKPRVRERYILPDFTREEAIDAFIKQSKPTPISFVQDDEMAPPAAPVWPELIFPKKELYTIQRWRMKETTPDKKFWRCFSGKPNLQQHSYYQEKGLELQPEEKEIFDLFITETNPTKVFHLVHGGNFSTVTQVQPSTVKTPNAESSSVEKPTLREKFILCELSREEAIGIFVKQSNTTSVSFVQDDKLAPPVWPELSFPKSELYTILEVEDEMDYTRKEIMEMFLGQTKLATVKFVQRGNLAHIVEERNPSFDDKMAPPAAPVWPELSFPKSELYTILEVEDEADYTREEIMEMFLRQTKLATVKFVQGGNLAHIVEEKNPTFDDEVAPPAAPLWPKITFPKKNLHTIAEVDDETNYTRQEVLEMFLRQTKLATVKFVQGGNLAHIIEERNPSFDDEMAPPAAPVWPEISFPKSELYTILEVEDETDYTRQEVLEVFLRQTKLATVKFVQGGNLAHIIEERNPSFDDEIPPPAARVWPEMTFPNRSLYTIAEVDDETGYTREEVLQMFLRQTNLATVN
ncbi:hypothetical protein WMY93_030423 [Mugilogobius chulae]|uniref:Uncharacterized protein n=1 Tax=Mugilogobius chulae TaxID=88201 RepID=A0AAW0MEG6_9GOBI